MAPRPPRRKANLLTDKLSDNDILDLLASAGADEEDEEPEFVRPFTEAGDLLIDWMANNDGRYMLGLPKVDSMTRGIGRGELCYVIGRSNSGKTQVVLQSIVNNPDKRVLFFTPDENDVLILTKLIAMYRGINAEELERRLQARDPEAMKMVHESTAHFKNLVVIDKSLTFHQMSKAKREAEKLWGAPTDIVVGDFLELFPGAGGEGASGVVAVSQGFKAWLKHENVGGMILHQSSRSSGDRGKSGGMEAMKYGGEQEAIYVIEVFRERERYDISKPDEAAEYKRTEHTVTVAVVKNKRPPGRKGECIFHMDPDTGVIRSLADVLPKTGLTEQRAPQPAFNDDEEPF